MADAVLDRVIADYKEQEREHTASIADNYRSLLEGKTPVLTPERTENVAPAAPAVEPARPAPAPVAHTATPVAPERTNHVTYRGETVYAAPAAATVESPTYAMPAAPAVDAVSDDDAVPTRRTMDTLRRTTVDTQAERKVGFFAALSTKMKVALAVVAVTIVALVALVCVNTSIINSMDARIDARQGQIQILEDELNGIEEDIANATNPDNVGEWAENNGMHKAN